MPEVKFDFYQIKGDLDKPLLFTFDNMSKKSPAECFYPIGKDKCILSRHQKYNDINCFLFTRIRMDQLPVKTKLSGERENLDLADDEGLGEDVALSYDSKLRIVAIQRNIHSISVSYLLDWLKKESENESLNFYPIIKAGAFSRFLDLDSLRKISFRLAKPNNLSFLKDSELSTDEKLSLQKLLIAPYVTMTLSCGREKNLSLNHLVKFVKNLVSLHKNNLGLVKSLEVTGYEDEQSEPVIIDLLEDKLIAKEIVPRLGRSIDADELLKASSRAISSNLKELQTYAS